MWPVLDIYRVRWFLAWGISRKFKGLYALSELYSGEGNFFFHRWAFPLPDMGPVRKHGLHFTSCFVWSTACTLYKWMTTTCSFCPFCFFFISDYSITDKRVSFKVYTLFLFHFLGSCLLGVPPFSPGSLGGTAHIVLIVTELRKYFDSVHLTHMVSSEHGAQVVSRARPFTHSLREGRVWGL